MGTKEMTTAKRISMASILLLIFAFLVYSCTGIFTKLASMQEMLSLSFFVCFGLIIVFLGGYAILWQIILRKVLLSQAFLFKSLTLVFSLFFAWSIFNEEITIKNVIGSCIIIVGIIINALNTSNV